MHARQSSDHARAGRATPLFIHAPGGERAKLKELSAGIDKQCNTLARREPAFLVLRLNRLVAAALADDLLFLAYLRDQLGDGALVAREARRIGLDLAFEGGG